MSDADIPNDILELFDLGGENVQKFNDIKRKRIFNATWAPDVTRFLHSGIELLYERRLEVVRWKSAGSTRVWSEAGKKRNLQERKNRPGGVWLRIWGHKYAMERHAQ
jgi:hypothetical protein